MKSRITSIIRIPASHVGRVIGKGGKKAKEIRQSSGVFRINISKEATDGSHDVTIVGPSKESCEVAQRAIVAAGCQNKYAQTQPASCGLCGTELTSMFSCITHLSGKGHMTKVGPMCLCGNCPPQKSHDLEALLSCPAQRERHIQLGFRIDDILSAKRRGVGTPRVDGARDSAITIPPDFNWMAELSRRYVGWDGQKLDGSPTEPSIEDSISRLRLDEPPPKFREPALPTPTPVPKTMTMSKLVWPRFVDIDLPLAVVKAREETLDGVHFIASSSFMYALCGESQVMKESFLLQRVGDSIAVKSQRVKTPHCSFDIGVLVEDLCCPSSLPDTMTTFSLAKFQVGDYGLMLSAEVDGLDPSTGECIEVKSRKKPGLQMWEIIQASVNGSFRIASITPSADKMNLESIQIFSVQDERERRKEKWTYKGQRAKYILSLIWNNSLVQSSTEAPVVMKFDTQKMPTFSLAPPGSSIIPADF